MPLRTHTLGSRSEMCRHLFLPLTSLPPQHGFLFFVWRANKASERSFLSCEPLLTPITESVCPVPIKREREGAIEYNWGLTLGISAQFPMIGSATPMRAAPPSAAPHWSSQPPRLPAPHCYSLTALTLSFTLTQILQEKFASLPSYGMRVILVH